MSREAPAPFLHASQHAPGGTDPLDVYYERRQQRLLIEAMGYKGENFSRFCTLGATAGDPISGRATYVGLQLMAGQTLTSLIIGCEQAGSGLTLTKMALWDAATFTQQAISGDVKASFTSVGVKIVNMLTPYTPVADTTIVAGYLSTTGTTNPGLTRVTGTATGIGTNGLISGGVIGRAGHQDSLSDLPASPSITRDGNATMIWVGWK